MSNTPLQRLAKYLYVQNALSLVDAMLKDAENDVAPWRKTQIEGDLALLQSILKILGYSLKIELRSDETANANLIQDLKGVRWLLESTEEMCA